MRQLLRFGLVGLACLGLLLPGPLVQAAEGTGGIAPRSRVKIGDVALLKGGILQGQVVDMQGKPMVRAAVSIRQSDREVAQTTTNPKGLFSVKGLAGGTYQVKVGESQSAFRLWADRTAPPNAAAGALLVCGKGAIRAQYSLPNGSHQGPLSYWLTNPWVIAGLVATAIVVPIAIHNHQADRDEQPSSP